MFAIVIALLFIIAIAATVYQMWRVAGAEIRRPYIQGRIAQAAAVLWISRTFARIAHRVLILDTIQQSITYLLVVYALLNGEQSAAGAGFWLVVIVGMVGSFAVHLWRIRYQMPALPRYAQIPDPQNPGHTMDDLDHNGHRIVVVDNNYLPGRFSLWWSYGILVGTNAILGGITLWTGVATGNRFTMAVGEIYLIAVALSVGALAWLVGSALSIFSQQAAFDSLRRIFWLLPAGIIVVLAPLFVLPDVGWGTAVLATTASFGSLYMASRQFPHSGWVRFLRWFVPLCVAVSYGWAALPDVGMVGAFKWSATNSGTWLGEFFTGQGGFRNTKWYVSIGLFVLGVVGLLVLSRIGDGVEGAGGAWGNIWAKPHRVGAWGFSMLTLLSLILFVFNVLGKKEVNLPFDMQVHASPIPKKPGEIRICWPIQGPSHQYRLERRPDYGGSTAWEAVKAGLRPAEHSDPEMCYVDKPSPCERSEYRIVVLGANGEWAFRSRPVSSACDAPTVAQAAPPPPTATVTAEPPLPPTSPWEERKKREAHSESPRPTQDARLAEAAEGNHIGGLVPGYNAGTKGLRP